MVALVLEEVEGEVGIPISPDQEASEGADHSQKSRRFGEWILISTYTQRYHLFAEIFIFA